MGTVAIRLSAATKRYGGRTVLSGLDLDVPRDGRLIVLGPSGSGKSTLLRVLAGLEPLDAGTRTHPDAGEAGALGQAPSSVPDGNTAAPGRTAITATVFQQPLLPPWLSVRDNVALGGRYRANRGRYDPARADELLELLGVAELATARPAELSGGQAQRVAIARAVAVRPDVLLCDEPFSALDPATRRGLQEWLRDAAERLGLTLVLVTHDVDEALYLGQTIAALDGSGAVGERWDNPVPPAHDELDRHPLRPALLASYRSQLPTGHPVDPVRAG